MLLASSRLFTALHLFVGVKGRAKRIVRDMDGSAKKVRPTGNGGVEREK